MYDSISLKTLTRSSTLHDKRMFLDETYKRVSHNSCRKKGSHSPHNSNKGTICIRVKPLALTERTYLRFKGEVRAPRASTRKVERSSPLLITSTHFSRAASTHTRTTNSTACVLTVHTYDSIVFWRQSSHKTFVSPRVS